MYFMTTTNKIYYGTAGIPNIIQLKIQPSPNSILWIDRFDRPSFVNLYASLSISVTKQLFDIKTELLNADYTVSCPYSMFSVHGSDPWFVRKTA